MQKYFYLFFGLSFLSLLTQVIFLREILCIFSGSEFILSFFWVIWFFSNACGIIINNFKPLKNELKFEIIFFLQFAAVIVSYLCLKSNIIFFRQGNNITAVIEGLCFGTFSIILPNILNGYIFNSVFKFLNEKNILVKLYFIESLSFVIAGITVHFSIYYITDFNFLAYTCLILSLVFLFIFRKSFLPLKFSIIFFILVVIIYYPELNKFFFQSAYPSFQWSREINTPFGRIDLLRHGKEFFPLYSGQPVIVDLEPGLDEEIVFTAYSQSAPEPEILIDGAVYLNILSKLSEISFKQITILVQNKIFYYSIKNYLPQEIKKLLETDKIIIEFQTLQNYLESNSNKKKFDIIFINSENLTRLQNTFYYLPYTLKQMKKSLSSSGVIEFIFPGEGEYISRESAFLKGSIFSNVKSIFNDAAVFPLNSTFILCSNNKIKKRFDEMNNTLNERAVKRIYFNDVNVGMRLSNSENIGISKIFNYNKKNSLLNPATISHGLVMNVAEYNIGLSKKITDFILVIKDNIFIYSLIFGILVAIIFAIFAKRNIYCASTFFGGISGLSIEIILIYLYQIYYGTLYQNIGLIISVFMIGLTVGIYISNFLIEIKLKKIICFSLFNISLFGVFIILFFYHYYLLIYISTLFIGMFQGILFNLISETYSHKINSKNKIIYLYINDLIGAASGNIFIPLIIIPLFGFIYPIILLFILQVIILIFSRWQNSATVSRV